MTRSLLALIGIWVTAFVSCGRTELNLCQSGVPCHTESICPGGACDGGLPDGHPDAPTCGAGLEVCGATCTDVRTDAANCGSCGNRCGSSQTCRNGSCGCSAPGQTSCGGACVLTATDPGHCGSCAHACGGGQACVSGACICPAGT